jgi:hypothetical protein
MARKPKRQPEDPRPADQTLPPVDTSPEPSPAPEGTTPETKPDPKPWEGLTVEHF